MKETLDEKIREVENEHAAEIVTAHTETHDQSRRDQANRFLGGAMAIDKLKEHLASQVMTALMTIEEENLYLEYGHKCFADFLDDNQFSQMSKSTYYRLRELFLKEGPAKYDLLTEWGVPAKFRKLLSSGDIEIDGDDVIIDGKERVNIAESRHIKAIIEKLVTEKNALAGDLHKAEERIEKKDTQIKRGIAEFDELQRALDATREGNPHDRSLGRIVECLLEHTEIVGQMDDTVKAKKGAGALETLWSVLLQVKKSYNVGFHFIESDPLSTFNSPLSTGEAGFDAKLQAAINEPDDLDAEEE